LAVNNSCNSGVVLEKPFIFGTEEWRRHHRHGPVLKKNVILEPGIKKHRHVEVAPKARKHPARVKTSPRVKRVERHHARPAGRHH
jgi:hypothetical protein